MKNEIKIRNEKEIREELIKSGFIVVLENEFLENEDKAICDGTGKRFQPNSETAVFLMLTDTHRWEYWHDDTIINIATFNSSPVSVLVLKSISSVLVKLGFQFLYDEDTIVFIVKTAFDKLFSEKLFNPKLKLAYIENVRESNTFHIFNCLSLQKIEIESFCYVDNIYTICLEFYIKKPKDYYVYRDKRNFTLPKDLYESDRFYESYEITSKVLKTIQSCGFIGEYCHKEKKFYASLIDFKPNYPG